MIPQAINLVALDKAVADSIKKAGSSTKAALDGAYLVLTPDPDHAGLYLMDGGGTG
jgi:hypothetical protein